MFDKNNKGKLKKQQNMDMLCISQHKELYIQIYNQWLSV